MSTVRNEEGVLVTTVHEVTATYYVEHDDTYPGGYCQIVRIVDAPGVGRVRCIVTSIGPYYVDEMSSKEIQEWAEEHIEHAADMERAKGYIYIQSREREDGTRLTREEEASVGAMVCPLENASVAA